MAANRPLVPSNLLSVAVAAGRCLRLGLDRAASPCTAPSPAAASYSPAGNTPKYTGWGSQYPHSQAKALLANQIHQPSPHCPIYTHRPPHELTPTLTHTDLCVNPHTPSHLYPHVHTQCRHFLIQHVCAQNPHTYVHTHAHSHTHTHPCIDPHTSPTHPHTH